LRVSSFEVWTVVASGPADDEAFGQLGLQRLGDRTHPREIRHALMIEPVPDLLGAEGFLADRDQRIGQFLTQADQVAPSVRQHAGRRAGWGRFHGARPR
jgi:hypothetical protein